MPATEKEKNKDGRRSSLGGQRLPAEALAKEGYLKPFHDLIMKYVYLLRSKSYPNEVYIGITSDLNKRLDGHHSGRSAHTSKFKPWKLVSFIAFSDGSKATEFERYLKTGSGRAFAKKRLW